MGNLPFDCTHWVHIMLKSSDSLHSKQIKFNKQQNHFEQLKQLLMATQQVRGHCHCTKHTHYHNSPPPPLTHSHTHTYTHWRTYGTLHEHTSHIKTPQSALHYTIHNRKLREWYTSNRTATGHKLIQSTTDSCSWHRSNKTAVAATIQNSYRIQFQAAVGDTVQMRQL